jgi:AraC-like DNA-binding protein
MDALSDLLRTVRLNGAAYLTGEFSAPWCVEAQAEAEISAAFLPGARRVISYHLIAEGSCMAQLEEPGEPPLALNAGELLVVTRGESHYMGSAMDAPRAGRKELADCIEMTPGGLIRLEHGGGGQRTRLVCGFLNGDDMAGHPLLDSLPRMFKVDMRGSSSSAWLESSLRFAAEEAAVARAGSATFLAKLSELLFVEAVRRCLDELPEEQKGWLAGLRDRFVGRALTHLHAKPAHSWTVDELASEVGLSRSAFAQRFADYLGVPPMQYLARWRLQLAAQLLRNTDYTLAAVAEKIGYESEAAFNRAFKREFGLPPASWRRGSMAN